MPLNWRAATRRLLPYVITAAAGFLLAYLVIFLFVFPDRVVPDDGSVPGVVGLDYSDAERRLAVAGYKAEVGLRRFNATAPQNAVLSQSPPPGTTLTRGSAVTLDVSAGQRTVEVPPVVGAPQEQARALLETAGFTVGAVTKQPSLDVANGAVAASSPPPGQRVPLPARVDLVVSSGRPTVVVPSVVGRTLAEAQLLLQQAGLQPGEIAVDPGAVDLPNTVTAQSAPAGSRLAAGAAVRLTVAGIGTGTPAGTPP